MVSSVADLSGIRFLWRGFRRLPSSHRHGEAAIAQRLLVAASAEPEILLTELDTTGEGLTRSGSGETRRLRPKSRCPPAPAYARRGADLARHEPAPFPSAYLGLGTPLFW